ncbi:hypothetical protein E3Q22_00241 [Wallemia mellicola]|uniref:Methylated-DNA-[protein]-cysteine S-methyltransferase DNA binding domain-containing protein n=2 Tax=Wallemia mellicola TaxID=1708541 RepID=A0A4T0S5W5_9BASI|nr:alkyltransferase-like protein Atl1 [Wallemia mellicola CBS 633.66]TIB75228.1 hypothetical protein E3Q24_00100 [Wallemia mellicola]EIM23250.1 alkyltransferase-like protein Atl1 [Wallemia mellicola CBS 633.66]TIB78211.1 hypothetical protein E3Q23_00873 [Wallemia mellicola]TIB82497.1 hypothetical protein E3Q22_00241 [Wallemia mellicola]TIB84916.1 hypothetical protein E3Q21_02170 [Wallemia mellicola]|eukprot:XP_006956641.1 alkyltransferase-like protein Atl1 [Wallemia mellicola CBS 633.66]
MEFHTGVYELVDSIPSGKVCTYGQIARQLNQPNHSRMVGQALKLLNPGSDIPWHRVVNSKGEISNRGDGGISVQRQAQRLQEEGVELHQTTENNYKLNLRLYMHEFTTS